MGFVLISSAECFLGIWLKSDFLENYLDFKPPIFFTKKVLFFTFFSIVCQIRIFWYFSLILVKCLVYDSSFKMPFDFFVLDKYFARNHARSLASQFASDNFSATWRRLKIIILKKKIFFLKLKECMFQLKKKIFNLVYKLAKKKINENDLIFSSTK